MLFNNLNNDNATILFNNVLPNINTLSTKNIDGEIFLINEEVDDNENILLTETIIKLNENGNVSEIININEDPNINTIDSIAKSSIIGYKLTVDKNNDFCVAELEITNSKVIFNINKNKFRTNKTKVLCIGKVHTINDVKYYFSTKYGTECCVCYFNITDNLIVLEDNILLQIIPCYHKICIKCFESLSKKECPLCKIDIKDYLEYSDIKSYSFVYGNMEYEIGKTYVIEDFDSDINNSCTTGIHFHTKVEDVYQWADYNKKNNINQNDKIKINNDVEINQNNDICSILFSCLFNISN